MKFVQIDDNGELIQKLVGGTDWKEILNAELCENTVDELLELGYEQVQGDGWIGIVDAEGEEEYYVCDEFVDMQKVLDFNLE